MAHIDTSDKIKVFILQRKDEKLSWAVKAVLKNMR